MNQQTKVIDAINNYERRKAEREQLESTAKAFLQTELEAREELIRVLHAVYGDRDTKGCMLDKKRYWVQHGRKDIAQADTLHVEEADFEVLG